MKTARIAIVGMGPRGLTVLERLVADSIWTNFVILSNGHTNVAARNARNPTSTGPFVYEQRGC